jgi:alkylated DNA repair dioxygenase AlkB
MRRISETQSDLFAETPKLPEGFAYRAEFIGGDEERQLLAGIAGLVFAPFEFQGFVGKRRTVSFGWKYDFSGGGLVEAEPLPDFLLPLRAQAAGFAGLPAAQLQQALIIDYPPGAVIGWHRDRPAFDKVIGISLLASCPLRLRRKIGATWQRRTLTLAPRSIYLLSGEVRSAWEHSIPALTEQRYSITFRSLREA